jgi:hypothetical protein
LIDSTSCSNFCHETDGKNQKRHGLVFDSSGASAIMAIDSVQSYRSLSILTLFCSLFAHVRKVIE